MCIRYVCRVCKASKIIYCESADAYHFDAGCSLPTYDPQPHKEKTCGTCKIVRGATIVLHNLVYQHPWLETEGFSGVENRQKWELGDLFKKDKNAYKWMGQWEDDINDRLKAMGLDQLEGREELNDGHGAAQTKESTVVEEVPNMAVEKEQEDDSTWNSGRHTLVSEEVVEKEMNDNVNEGRTTDDGQLTWIGGQFH